MNRFEEPIPVLKSTNPVKEIMEFIDYCSAFYNNKTGIYPIATYDEIVEAVGEFLRTPTDVEIVFDSLDRERVRMILQPEYQMF